ncbi:hypothetical protein D3C71_1640280 [compost metagenome]
MHRLRNGLTGNHARSNLFDRGGFGRIDRTFTVDRLTQRVNHAANQLRTYRHFQNATGTFNFLTFGDVLVLAQDHGTNGVTLQVHGQAKGVARELEHFTLHHVCQAMDTNDTVGYGDHGTFGTRLYTFGQVLNLRLDQVTDFRGVQLHDLS